MRQTLIRLLLTTATTTTTTSKALVWTGDMFTGKDYLY